MYCFASLRPWIFSSLARALLYIATEAAKMVFVVCYRTPYLFCRGAPYHFKSFEIKLKFWKSRKLEVIEILALETRFLRNWSGIFSELFQFVHRRSRSSEGVESSYFESLSPFFSKRPVSLQNHGDQLLLRSEIAACKIRKYKFISAGSIS